MATWKIFDMVIQFNSLYSKEHMKIIETRPREIGFVLCGHWSFSEVRKLNVVAQKRSGRPRKSWDEVIKNDRKKLDMDSADPQNRSEWRGRLRGRLVKKPNPR